MININGFPNIVIDDCLLINGNCLEVIKQIPNNSIDLILTDLPYTFKGKHRVTANKWDLPIDDKILFEHYLRIIKDTSPIILFASNPFASYLIMNHLEYFKYEWIWEKDNGSNFTHTKYQPFKVHELILVFGKSATSYNKQNKNLTYNPQFTYSKPYNIIRDMSDSINLSGFKGRTNTNNSDGKRYPRSVQKVNIERGYHPTQKAVKLLEYIIKTYTDTSNLVLDNTAGSFSTGIACQNTNRKFIGIELEEKYYNIGIERMINNKVNK